jgi:hypothetical protein
MVRLLVFCELIDELQTPQTDVAQQQASDEENSKSLSETEPVEVLRFPTAPTSVVADQVSGLVRLSGVAASQPRREFKIHAGQMAEFLFRFE